MKKLLSISFFAALAMVSCKKSASPTPDTLPKTTSAIVVPAGFTWENSRTVSISVTISDAQFSGIHVVNIYDGDPSVDGKLLIKGSATTLAPYSSKIYLSAQHTNMFVVSTAPNNVSATQKVIIGTNNVLNVSMVN